MRRLKFKNQDILLLCVLVLDQITKFVIAMWAQQGWRGTRVTSFLNLTYVQNTGVSFGLLKDLNALHPHFLSFLTLFIAFGFYLWCQKARTFALRYGLVLIVGGALGNILDRFCRLGVVDFIDFHLKSWNFPAFNIADIAITSGALLLLYDTFFLRKGS